MALKIMKRRLTHSAVAHTTQTGAPLASSGSVASCALPANTSSDISSISGSGRPLLPIATPVISPQAAMPTAVPSISRAPRANSGWRQAGAAAVGLPASAGSAGGLVTDRLSPAPVVALRRGAVAGAGQRRQENGPRVAAPGKRPQGSGVGCSCRGAGTRRGQRRVTLPLPAIERLTVAAPV